MNKKFCFWLTIAFWVFRNDVTALHTLHRTISSLHLRFGGKMLKVRIKGTKCCEDFGSNDKSIMKYCNLCLEMIPFPWASPSINSVSWFATLKHGLMQKARKLTKINFSIINATLWTLKMGCLRSGSRFQKWDVCFGVWPLHTSAQKFCISRIKCFVDVRTIWQIVLYSWTYNRGLL